MVRLVLWSVETGHNQMIHEWPGVDVVGDDHNEFYASVLRQDQSTDHVYYFNVIEEG